MPDHLYSATEAALHPNCEYDRQAFFAAQRAVFDDWKAHSAASIRAAKSSPEGPSEMDRRVQAEVGPVASHEERTRARKRLNQRDSRRQRDEAATASKAIEAAVAGLDIGRCRPGTARQQLAVDAIALTAWLALPGKRQEQLRKHKAAILASRYLLLVEREDRMEPTYERFAELMRFAAQRKPGVFGEGPITRRVAQNKLQVLSALELPGGPFYLT